MNRAAFQPASHFADRAGGSHLNIIEIPIDAQTANQSSATKLQCCGFQCAGAPETFGFFEPSRQRLVNVAFCQRTDIDGHRTIAEIALWIARTRRRAPNCRMTRKIDRVGDKGSGRIGQQPPSERELSQRRLFQAKNCGHATLKWQRRGLSHVP